MAKELTPRVEELKELGWTNEDLSRYSELWEYRQRWGAINLEREDRQFLRKAESVLPKITTGKVSIKKLISEKSYYRWLSFYLNEMNEAEKLFKLSEGDRGTWPIIIEEEIRLLDYYQPVLGLPDTLKAKSLIQFREDISKSVFSSNKNEIKTLEFDFVAPLEALKAKEKSNWKSLRESIGTTARDYPILPKTYVGEFRQKVRSELTPLFVKLLPSLSDTKKPYPQDN